MKYLNGLFTETLNLLLGREEIKYIPVKAQKLARDSIMTVAGYSPQIHPVVS